MKRFLTATVFCASLLIVCAFVVTRRSAGAGEDLVRQLLNLPAPPPLNPLVTDTFPARDISFYDPEKPPPDDASIDDLIDYWTHQATAEPGRLNYKPEPSGKVLQRLLDDAAKHPEQLSDLLAILPDDQRTADAVQAIYEREKAKNKSEADPDSDSDQDGELRSWLRLNSDKYSGELEKGASRLRDVNN